MPLRSEAKSPGHRRRKTLSATPLTKAILRGRNRPIETVTSEGAMLQRVYKICSAARR